jgi:hypothetical protein
LSATGLNASWSPSATARAFWGISAPEEACWAWATFALLGVEHEKDRNARENPKIIPIRTRLKMKKLLDDNFRIRFITVSFASMYILSGRLPDQSSAIACHYSKFKSFKIVTLKAGQAT